MLFMKINKKKRKKFKMLFMYYGCTYSVRKYMKICSVSKSQEYNITC